MALTVSAACKPARQHIRSKLDKNIRHGLGHGLPAAYYFHFSLCSSPPKSPRYPSWPHPERGSPPVPIPGRPHCPAPPAAAAWCGLAAGLAGWPPVPLAPRPLGALRRRQLPVSRPERLAGRSARRPVPAAEKRTHQNHDQSVAFNYPSPKTLGLQEPPGRPLGSSS
jgi:hypothetical protein